MRCSARIFLHQIHVTPQFLSDLRFTHDVPMLPTTVKYEGAPLFIDTTLPVNLSC